eukprot:COSAG06_NODE_669_length_13222_cov_8.235922_6_plen_308_part_00
MFVPSLSWQNHRFLYINGSKRPFLAGGTFRSGVCEGNNGAASSRRICIGPVGANCRVGRRGRRRRRRRRGAHMPAAPLRGVLPLGGGAAAARGGCRPQPQIPPAGARKKKKKKKKKKKSICAVFLLSFSLAMFVPSLSWQTTTVHTDTERFWTLEKEAPFACVLQEKLAQKFLPPAAAGGGDDAAGELGNKTDDMWLWSAKEATTCRLQQFAQRYTDGAVRTHTSFRCHCVLKTAPNACQDRLGTSTGVQRRRKTLNERHACAGAEGENRRWAASTGAKTKTRQDKTKHAPVVSFQHAFVLLSKLYI